MHACRSSKIEVCLFLDYFFFHFIPLVDLDEGEDENL